MAKLTTTPTIFGFGDRSVLAEPLATGAEVCKLSPIVEEIQGVSTRRGFHTPRAFIVFELGGVAERASYGTLSVDPDTGITTLSDITRQLDPENGSDFTSHGSGQSWPKGTRVYVSVDPGILSNGASTDVANTFTAKQTFDAGLCINNAPINSPQMTEAERDAIAAPVNGMIIFNTTSGVPNQYYGGVWNVPGTSTVSNASETVSGIVQKATTVEVQAGTEDGSTGAKLFVGPEEFIDTTDETANDAGKPVKTDANGKIADEFITFPALPVIQDIAFDGTWNSNPNAASKNSLYNILIDPFIATVPVLEFVGSKESVTYFISASNVGQTILQVTLDSANNNLIFGYSSSGSFSVGISGNIYQYKTV